jgi:hypothetical protein
MYTFCFLRLAGPEKYWFYRFLRSDIAVLGVLLAIIRDPFSE